MSRHFNHYYLDRSLKEKGMADSLVKLPPESGGETWQVKLKEVLDKANDVLLGKDKEIRLAITSMVAGGHLLIEDVPGVGKTTLVYLLSHLMGLDLKRIQFTNDLLPGDILGTMVFHKESESFEFKKGPIFGQLILADELNRATPKTQSALLQCMEEGRVTVEGQEFQLDDPFLIVATQNPFFQVGTFQLPESQLDRFFMSLHLDFPAREFEKKILLQSETRELIDGLKSVLNASDVVDIREQIKSVIVSDILLEYLLDLLEKGRSELEEGAYLSPRAGKDLIQGARAYAFLEGRDYVVPDDIQQVAPYILGHRLGGGKGVVYGQNLIKDLIKKVPVGT